MSVFETISIYLPHLLSVPLLPLALLATTVLTLSTLAAADTTVEERQEQRQKEESGEAVALTKLHALGFIVTASIGLLAMWMWANVLVYLSLFCFCLSAFVSIQQCTPGILNSCGIRQEYGHGPFAALFVLVWFWQRNTSHAWILQNIMGGFNITLMLRVLKASSMSTPTLLLLMAFVYDVFFVFVTPYLTRSGESIMVAAATGAAMTVKETIPMLFRIPSFNGDGEAILGFGDVVLPGILVTFLKECDARLEEDQSTTGLLSSLGGLTTASASMMLKSGQQQSTWWWRKGGRWGYHLTAIVGFFIGLQVTYVAMMWSQKGQPALLYLVPCTLIPVVLLASRRHELSLLWNGWGDLDGDYEEEDQDEDDRQDQKLGSGDRKELEGRLEIETSDI